MNALCRDRISCCVVRKRERSRGAASLGRFIVVSISRQQHLAEWLISGSDSQGGDIDAFHSHQLGIQVVEVLVGGDDHRVLDRR